MILPCTLEGSNNNSLYKIKTAAMIDSGATGETFIDSSFAQSHNFKFLELDKP